MKLKRLIYIIITAALLPFADLCLEALDAAPSAFALEAPAAKRKKTSSKKRKSTKKKSTKKRTTRKKATTKKPTPAPDPVSYDSLTLRVNDSVMNWIPKQLNPGGLRVNSVKPDKNQRTARIGLNENFTYLPVTNELIGNLQEVVKGALPDSIADYSVNLYVGNRSMAYYITKVDKLPPEARKNPPFVVPLNPYVNPEKGMEGDIVALWSSHGRYFKPGSGAWMWQRPLLFETVEDTYTMGYVLPYIVPMLENAGAYVMLPRERDTNRHEVIVDNDVNEGGDIFSQPYYREKSGTTRWRTGEEEGFIYDLKEFRDTENPFEVGTYRETETVRGGTPSVAAWYADIPADGEYAVYVSYHTLPNSTQDARYTVNYSGGSREFKVNQTMGGSTWIYLGTFPLEAGYSDTEPVVTLTNLTEGAAGTVVTADAVKIGGGMGNIARSNRRSDIYYDPSTPLDDIEEDEADEEDEEEVDIEATEEEGDIADGQPAPSGNDQKSQRPGAAPVFTTSGYPRFLEGARYWLHWAGFPEYVYSPYHGSDDYKDDYTSRGNWVNYLAGGSRVLPNKSGLNIPVDVTMALHSDAGKRADDSFVGTLGIYFTNDGDYYADGTPRINSRMLTDMLMRQITTDIRKEYEPSWTRRSMWDKSYVEARVPEVPTSLIELMSHQNFADMQYGLDPNFRFDVGRAIYKGLARFMAERKDRELVIQPLPVHDFAIQRRGKNTFRLSWQPTDDPLEPTAKPDKYVIFERTEGDLGFRRIGETKSTHYDVKVSDTYIHSFRIVAANEGGLSFPSETLALREGDNHQEPVLIVNGFSRVSGPAVVNENGRSGFDSEQDFGVPYIKDISFTGHQTEFNRNAGESFGRSSNTYATQVIAGNTFDFTALHGESIADAGYGFVSCSAGAVESGEVKLHDYKIVDLILGKQKSTVVGNGMSGVRYRTFAPQLQQVLRHYIDHGGRLFVSGQYIVSDLYGKYSTASDRAFADDILGIRPAEASGRERSGRVEASGSILSPASYKYSNTLNSERYIVEQPDVLEIAPGKDGQVIMRLSDTGDVAGVAVRDGKSRVAAMSVPFEAITEPTQRERLMKEILEFLD